MDNAQFRLGGQVEGLVTVLQTLIGMQLMSQAKTEADLPRQAELARRLHAHLLDQVERIRDSAPPELNSLGVHDAMLGGMRDVVDRCFDQPTKMMEQIADIALELAEPPSTTAN